MHGSRHDIQHQDVMGGVGDRQIRSRLNDSVVAIGRHIRQSPNRTRSFPRSDRSQQSTRPAWELTSDVSDPANTWRLCASSSPKAVMWAGSSGMAQLDFLVLLEVVHVEVAMGLELRPRCSCYRQGAIVEIPLAWIIPPTASVATGRAQWAVDRRQHRPTRTLHRHIGAARDDGRGRLGPCTHR